MNGPVFKICSKLSENWLEQILRIFPSMFAPNRADWYMNGPPFLQNLIYESTYLKIPNGSSLPIPNLCNPPPHTHTHFGSKTSRITCMRDAEMADNNIHIHSSYHDINIVNTEYKSPQFDTPRIPYLFSEYSFYCYSFILIKHFHFYLFIYLLIFLLVHANHFQTGKPLLRYMKLVCSEQRSVGLAKPYIILYTPFIDLSRLIG